MKFFVLPPSQIIKIPERTGVYQFLDKQERILYIGKAANLKERVKNHFRQPAYKDNLFLKQVGGIGYLPTNSEIEAMILESQLIKKHQPKYNTVWRDDKNYFYVGITKENLPRVFISHQTKSKNFKINYIGPFVDGRSLKQTLRYLRKIIPYYTTGNHPKTPCPWCHLNLCPGPDPNRKYYQKTIKNLLNILQGKSQTVLRGLKREMASLAKEEKFEAAASLRNQIADLERIMEHGRIFTAQRKLPGESWPKTRTILQNILKSEKMISRIEAYDISNIQGHEATGSMVVFVNGEANKNLYRKFKIRMEAKPNDTAMIREIISRRLEHSEWPYPELILIDGGRGQLNAAVEEIIRGAHKKIPVLALAKKHNELFFENRKKTVLLKKLPREISNLVLQLRDEAHRFAITYHKMLRKKELVSQEDLTRHGLSKK